MFLKKFDKKSQRLLTSDLAGIQYLGLDGITSSCIMAITHLINSGVLLKTASLITFDANHAFVFTTEFEEIIVVKAGFSSGYAGEGPRGLATVLTLLYRHNVEVDEYRVEPAFMHRLGYSCLLQSDLDFIKNQNPVLPRRWYDYIFDQGWDLDKRRKEVSSHYPLSIPFGLIDERIIDLAVAFQKNMDAAIISAYRRLEDVLRKRTGLTGEGTRLFSKAFLSDDAPLQWDVPDEGEAKGRANLFNATYMAFRNARAHREVESSGNTALREFMLVNEPYRLEAEAMTGVEIIEKRKAHIELEDTLRTLHQDPY